MKYLDEFRDKNLVRIATRKILEVVDSKRTCRFMEVCGTHTMAIFRYGLKSLLPHNIELISGPGCPVCVTEDEYIGKAAALGKINGTIIATFGDMMRVPGWETSLETEKSEGGDIRIVYSTSDALHLALKNPKKKIVFLGIGFETTAPTVASSILEAEEKRIRNYFVLSGHKLIPPALDILAGDKNIAIDGFILPAHVSAIIGSKPYQFLVRTFHIPCVITGFEPLDILQGIYMLLSQISKDKPDIQIQYNRVVKNEGNRRAQQIMNEVFEKTDTHWRGFGRIGNSGLKIKDRFRHFDAERTFKIRLKKKEEAKDCMCGEVLRGIRKPIDCRLFKNRCNPDHPVGPCMVSSEGTCAAYFKYNETMTYGGQRPT